MSLVFPPTITELDSSLWEGTNTWADPLSVDFKAKLHFTPQSCSLCTVRVSVFIVSGLEAVLLYLLGCFAGVCLKMDNAPKRQNKRVHFPFNCLAKFNCL